MLANWIVPCRRAVITSPTSGWSMFSLWGLQLFDHRARLEEWYGLNSEQYLRGMEDSP